MSGLPVIPLVLHLWNLKIQEMLKMLCGVLMERECVEPEFVLRCPLDVVGVEVVAVAEEDLVPPATPGHGRLEGVLTVDRGQGADHRDDHVLTLETDVTETSCSLDLRHLLLGSDPSWGFLLVKYYWYFCTILLSDRSPIDVHIENAV